MALYKCVIIDWLIDWLYGVCLCAWRDETGQYVLKVGQDRELRLFIRVRNRGEDAHEAAVTVILPPLMEYLGTDSDVSTIFKVILTLTNNL